VSTRWRFGLLLAPFSGEPVVAFFYRIYRIEVIRRERRGRFGDRDVEGEFAACSGRAITLSEIRSVEGPVRLPGANGFRQDVCYRKLSDLEAGSSKSISSGPARRSASSASTPLLSEASCRRRRNRRIR
jgi:hypothetical protein